MDALDEIRSRVEADGVEFIYAMFVEMHGKPCAKLVPVGALEGLMSDRRRVRRVRGRPDGPGPPPAPTSWPCPTRRPIRSSRGSRTWPPCSATPTVEGELWPYAPRVILRRALDAAAERNIVLKCGVEAEYSLVVRRDDGSIAVADDRDDMPLPCYDAKGLTRMLPHLTAVSKNLDAMGWGNYANDHEDANGPVRAELAVLRRADHRRPAHPVPADGAHPGPARRPLRHVHAQAVR